MTAPTVTAVFDFDTERYVLMATSHGVCNPAGPRLFRGGDLPNVQFSHVDQTEAERDRDALQTYINLVWSGKAPRSKGREEAEQPALTKADFANAVWTL